MTEIEESPSVCVVCDTSIDPDDVIFANYGDALCNECVQICNRCDWIGSVNDDFHTVDADFTWCEDCTQNRAYWCDSCGEYNSNYTGYVVDRGENYCEDCLANSAYYCEDCDEYNADGCDSCVDGGGRLIHDYSYRPDPIFHSTSNGERLYFGIEIEVESGRTFTLKDTAEYAQRLEDLGLAYLKHDGSLNNGFEIVTHPMSHSFYKSEDAQEFWKTLETLRNNYKVKSWDTSTCGLHIHISRNGFSGGAHMHNFLNLVYSNQRFYETLAGRSSDQWAKFTDNFQREYARDSEGNRIFTPEGGYEITSKRTFAHKLDMNRSSDRYSAVNTNNHHTLEMRIFRGTVNGDTVQAHLDLAHASVEYTRHLNSSAVIAGALLAENFITYIELNQELYPNLYNRIAKLMPSVGLARQEVSA